MQPLHPDDRNEIAAVQRHCLDVVRARTGHVVKADASLAPLSEGVVVLGIDFNRRREARNRILELALEDVSDALVVMRDRKTAISAQRFIEVGDGLGELTQTAIGEAPAIVFAADSRAAALLQCHSR